MIIDIVELRDDLAEGMKRICREVNCCVSVEEEMKENVNAENTSNAQRVSENSGLSDDEQ